MQRNVLISFIALTLIVPSMVFADPLPLCEYPSYNDGVQPQMLVYYDSRNWLDPETGGSNPNGGIKFEMIFWNMLLADGSLVTDNVKKVVFRNTDTKNAYIARTADIYEFMDYTVGEYSLWLGDRLVLFGNWKAVVVMNDGTHYRVDFAITEEMLQQPKPELVEDIEFIANPDGSENVICYAPVIANQEFRLRIFDDDGIVYQNKLAFPASHELTFYIPAEFTEYTKARVETRDHGGPWFGYDSQTCEWKSYHGRSLIWIEIP